MSFTRTPSPTSARKVALITGGTFGIGRATAEGLARKGYQVVLTGRDRNRAETAVRQIQQATGNAEISSLLGDFTLTSEVKRLADRFLEQHQRLDVLINNAGGQFSTRALTPEGFERTWALNHLAYAALTLKLLPVLQQSRPARIVNVASGWYSRNLPWKDLTRERGYHAGVAYLESKLANILFTYALARRLEGSGITVNAVNPGMIDTGLGRGSTGLNQLIQVLLQPLRKSPETGAFPSLHLASAAEVEGITGQFFDKTRFRPTARFTQNPELQDRLWKVTLEQLQMAETGLLSGLNRQQVNPSHPVLHP
ncbi:SDR family oxidoreductase [Deinococcus cellulosilyticus]|uniref:Retinol dehydrogenase n=1 Tax=Deinococcus cellulosilyticus (strain DSM 18568 / NBRC 106333 / KACC 11606 / 5516J-15) TaxID=1223518 RepID=A0A511N0J1_DEIC1|nr:SDR family oxidoreductase [Deinococcus cellulosilyticus]GEM46329.1 retinol dehydrogenase [Deinococcus cellulosilyticus NBRC 106333 = KACC 11606]